MSTVQATVSTPNLLSRILSRLGDALFADSWACEQREMERYLSQAQSPEDLEYRQRAWDRNRSRDNGFVRF